MLYQTVRAFHSVWIYIRGVYRSLCPLPTEPTFSNEWMMVTDDYTLERVSFPENMRTNIDIATRTAPNGHTDERRAIWHKDVTRKGYYHYHLFDLCSPPWYMITCNGKDMTAELAPYICPGNVIDREFLNIFVKDGNWRIMDPKTFEEVEFPSEPVVIQNAQ